MDIFRGVVAIRLCNEGSRSEGRFAYLCCEDGGWELTREGGVPFNDPYYEPFDGLDVEVEGRQSGSFIIVEKISESVAEVETSEGEELKD
jgi:hypothetical protein